MKRIGSALTSLIVLVSLVALACTAPTAEQPAPAAPAAPASSEQAQPKTDDAMAKTDDAMAKPEKAMPIAGQPIPGGTLNLLYNDDPQDFDVTYNGQSGTNGDSNKIAYDSLLSYKFTPGAKADYWHSNLGPRLAESWKASPDAKSFTFKLRKGVKWADTAPVNGRELNSSDVKFSYEYLARFGEFKDLPRSQQGFAFEGMTGIETPDPYTVVVNFKQGFAPFPKWAASGLTPIMPREIYDADGHLKDNQVGTGAHQLNRDATQAGSVWVFSKNPTYWNPGKPYLDEVRGIIVKDSATAHAAFQTKQVDILAVDELTATDIADTIPDAIRYDYPGNGYFIWMFTKKGPTEDFRVRQAISLAINPDAFINGPGQGLGRWSLGVEVPLFDLFSQEEVKKLRPYDPEKAKQLIKEAGYADGVDIEMTYSTSSGQTWISMAELAQAQLKRVGVNLVLKGTAYLESAKTRQEHKFQMNLITIRSRIDTDGVLFPTFFPGLRTNYAEVDDPILTKLLTDQRSEVDPAKRRELHREAVIYVTTKVTPLVNLYGRNSTTFWQPYLRKYAPHLDNRYFEEIWLEK